MIANNKIFYFNHRSKKYLLDSIKLYKLNKTKPRELSAKIKTTLWFIPPNIYFIAFHLKPHRSKVFLSV